MNDIIVSNDIIPVGEFKAGLAKYLKEIQNDRSALIITQNGRPSGVLISPNEFDKLRATNNFIQSVSRGLAESENKEVFSTSQLKDELQKLRARNGR